MKPPAETASSYLEHRALLLLLLAASAALGWILLPFFSAILWGFIIALLFTPWYQWLLPRMRARRTAAALVTLLVVLVMVGRERLFKPWTRFKT